LALARDWPRTSWSPWPLVPVWLRSLRPFPLKRRGPSRIDSSTWR